MRFPESAPQAHPSTLPCSQAADQTPASALAPQLAVLDPRRPAAAPLSTIAAPPTPATAPRSNRATAPCTSSAPTCHAVACSERRVLGARSGSARATTRSGSFMSGAAVGGFVLRTAKCAQTRCRTAACDGLRSSGDIGSHRRSGGRRWHPVDGRLHLANSSNAAHFANESATVRRLVEPYPLPDRATCAGTPLSNHPGGEL